MGDEVREHEPEEARAVVLAFVDAMAREDFEGACTCFSNASRAFVLTLAGATGLKTESCGAAWAHLVKRDTDVDARTLTAMWAQARGFTVEVRLTADRATAEFNPPRNHDSPDVLTARRVSDTLRLTNGLPMVREDGKWKLGLRGVDDRPFG